jgi:hypothetical protein
VLAKFFFSLNPSAVANTPIYRGQVSHISSTGFGQHAVSVRSADVHMDESVVIQGEVEAPESVDDLLSQIFPVDGDIPVDDLVRLCATTDRGQRASAADRERLSDLVRQCEAGAPEADALDLNGDWRLICSLGESVYRSSPFFWAFRQSTMGLRTPVGIPGADVESGDALSSAIYGVTDTIPFYDIGVAMQRFSGVCSETKGCPVPEEDESSDGDELSKPSDGSYAPMTIEPGKLESQVDLRIGRLFGLPSMSSMMTTTATVEAMPSDSDNSNAVDVELQIQQTAAKASTIADLFPPVEQLLSFPSGDALELARKGSSRVQLRSTFPTRDLRISRPVLSNAPDEEVGAVFVYVRESSL